MKSLDNWDDDDLPPEPLEWGPTERLLIAFVIAALFVRLFGL